MDAGAQQRLSANPVAFQMCEASLRLFCATSEPGPRERARAVSRPGAQQFSAVYEQLPIPVLCMGLLVHGAVCLHLTVLEKEISCLVLTKKGRACRQPSALWVNTHTHACSPAFLNKFLSHSSEPQLALPALHTTGCPLCSIKASFQPCSGPMPAAATWGRPAPALCVGTALLSTAFLPMGCPVWAAESFARALLGSALPSAGF